MGFNSVFKGLITQYKKLEGTSFHNACSSKGK